MMPANLVDNSDCFAYNNCITSEMKHKKAVSGAMADLNNSDLLASERNIGGDLSGLLAASDVFMDAYPLATLTLYGTFLRTYELCKGVDFGLLDLNQLKGHLNYGLERNDGLKHSTFHRLLKNLSDGPSGFSFQKDKGLGLITIKDIDKRSKGVLITDAGHDIVAKMTDAQRIKEERAYYDAAMDLIEQSNDFRKSPEMQYAKELFMNGHTNDEVNELVRKWREENPDLVFKRRGTQEIDMPVPAGVTDKWLEKYKALETDAEREAMLKQAGLFADELMSRMMLMGELSTKRKRAVTFTVNRDWAKTKDGQGRLVELLNRVRAMEKGEKVDFDPKAMRELFSKRAGYYQTTIPLSKIRKNTEDNKVARLEEENAKLEARLARIEAMLAKGDQDAS